MSRQNEFTYITYKAGTPLVLTGKLRGRVQSAHNNKASLDESSKKIISSKITENYQDWKSIIPYNEKQAKITKIRTYQNKENQYTTDKSIPCGAALLMSKQPTVTSKGRKIIQQPNHSTQSKRQRRHFYKNNLESPAVLEFFAQQPSLNMQQTMVNPHPHTESLKQKIQKDIKGFHDNYAPSTKKNDRKRNPDRDLFKEGLQLGYDLQHEKKLSSMKRAQLMGTYSFQRNPHPPQRKTDWRKSSFTLG